MIRTLILVSAFAALAGAASAAEYHVSLVGKDMATIRSDIDQAAKMACREASLGEYGACVTETYRIAMDKVLKAQPAK